MRTRTILPINSRARSFFCRILRAVPAALILVAFPLAISADEDAVSIKLAPLAWDSTIRDLIYFDRGNPEKIFIPSGAPGKPYRYRGARDIIFYTEGRNEEGEVIYQRKAATRLPITQGEILLLFVPRTNGDVGDRYRIVPIPIDTERFTAGSFKFYNLTPDRVAFRVDDNRFVLEPGHNRIAGFGDDRIGNVIIQIAASTDQEDWRPLYQSRWSAPGGQRRVWVFIHSTDGNYPRIKRYYEFISD